MIRITSNAKTVARRFRQRRKNLYPRAIRTFLQQVIGEAKEFAVEQSSFREYVIGRGRETLGIIALGETRRVAPYSKRRPADSGPTKDSEINIQSGEYVRGWGAAYRFTPNRYMAGLFNRAPHAEYLHTIGGAGWMRERLILRGITQRTLRRSFRRYVGRLQRQGVGSMPKN